MMQNLNADFFEMLDRCTEPSHVEIAWQQLMTKLGYERSGILVFSWQKGHLEVPRHSTNWEAGLLAEYFSEGFYRFDPIGNPLRKSSLFVANHIDAYSVTGKSEEASRFVDWVHSLNFPGQVSVVVLVAPGLRLGMTGFSEEGERKFRMLAQETKDNIRLAANAGAARFTQLTNGVIYPKGNPLSPREIECLIWLAKGDRVADIAQRLSVNSKTVEFHLSGARQKLSAKTSTEAVVISVINHYIQP